MKQNILFPAAPSNGCTYAGETSSWLRIRKLLYARYSLSQTTNIVSDMRLRLYNIIFKKIFALSANSRLFL